MNTIVNLAQNLSTLELNVFGITLTWAGQNREGAIITSTMREESTVENELFNSGVDAIESLILAHFCAGIDVSTPGYLEGIESAYQALGNNIDIDLTSVFENSENNEPPHQLLMVLVSHGGDTALYLDGVQIIAADNTDDSGSLLTDIAAKLSKSLNTEIEEIIIYDLDEHWNWDEIKKSLIDDGTMRDFKESQVSEEFDEERWGFGPNDVVNYVTFDTPPSEAPFYFKNGRTNTGAGCFPCVVADPELLFAENINIFIDWLKTNIESDLFFSQDDNGVKTHPHHVLEALAQSPKNQIEILKEYVGSWLQDNIDMESEISFGFNFEGLEVDSKTMISSLI